MPEVGLKGARVVPLGGQREPAGVPQHVRMRLEAEPRLHASPSDDNGVPFRRWKRVAVVIWRIDPERYYVVYGWVTPRQ